MTGRNQMTCRDVTLGYDGQIVTQELNFTVQEGDYLCILGENGSGKSTLIKALLGLKPQISGSIEWGEGMNNRQIGYLPQQTVVQRDFPASVREIVRSGFAAKMGFRPFYTAQEKKFAEQTMERLGIEAFAQRSYRNLSGGQQQRVLLARALCAAQKMLLLDEPVTGLDPMAQNELYAQIRTLHREGVTILMVSHDIAAAVRDATHILHIGSRKQLFFGTAEQYRSSEIGRAYLQEEVLSHA